MPRNIRPKERAPIPDLTIKEEPFRLDKRAAIVAIILGPLLLATAIFWVKTTISRTQSEFPASPAIIAR